MAIYYTTMCVVPGLPVALYNVGGHYFAGKGVELSFQKAADYYQQSADKGFAPAQVSLVNRERTVCVRCEVYTHMYLSRSTAWVLSDCNIYLYGPVICFVLGRLIECWHLVMQYSQESLAV